MGGVDAGLADPADLQGDQSAEEFLRLIHIGGNVVVDEEDEWLLDPADLLDNLIYRTARLRIGEKRLYSAEFAAKVTPAPRLNEPNRQIAFAGKDGTVRTKPRQRRPAGPSIHGLQTAVQKIIHDLRPEAFRLADNDRFGVLSHFFRHQCRMKTAHHHRNAAAAILRSNLVGTLRRVG